MFKNPFKKTCKTLKAIFPGIMRKPVAKAVIVTAKKVIPIATDVVYAPVVQTRPVDTPLFHAEAMDTAKPELVYYAGMLVPPVKAHSEGTKMLATLVITSILVGLACLLSIYTRPFRIYLYQSVDFMSMLGVSLSDIFTGMYELMETFEPMWIPFSVSDLNVATVENEVSMSIFNEVSLKFSIF